MISKPRYFRPGELGVEVLDRARGSDEQHADEVLARCDDRAAATGAKPTAIRSSRATPIGKAVTM